MSDKKARVPQIRFAGFTGDWEERKVGDLGSVVMNRRIYKEQTSDNGDVPFYKIGTFGSEPDAFISRELFEEYKAKYPYPKIGDVLISASGSIGKTVVYTGKDEYFQDSNIVWLQHDNRLLNSFLKQFYTVVEWSGLEGSTIKRLYNKNILDTPISLPKPEEQKKVGQLFIEFDNLITLQQRQLDKLAIVKKTMLEKMFPKDGANVPEIRFAGFTGAWEERKLQDVATFLTGNGFSWKDISGNGVRECVLYGNLYTDYGVITDTVTYKTNSRFQNEVFSQFGDVLIPASDTTPTGLARATSLEKTGVLLGGDINIIRPNSNVHGSCLSLAINLEKKQLLRLIKGTTVRHIHNSDIQNIFVTLPISLHEQESIVSFFKLIENLLTLHQRELNTLKTLKKSMLQQLFV